MRGSSVRLAAAAAVLAAAFVSLPRASAPGQVVTTFSTKRGTAISSAEVDAAFGRALLASRLGQPNGAAPLGADGRVPAANLDLSGLLPRTGGSVTGDVSVGGTLSAASATLSGALSSAVTGSEFVTAAWARSWRPQLAASPMEVGQAQMHRDLAAAYWDQGPGWPAGYSMPRIRPTRGGGAVLGQVDNSLTRNGPLWQWAEYANVVYWQWKVTGDHAARQRLVQQWEYARSIYTLAELGGDGAADGPTVGTVDDAGVKAVWLAQAHEATGDPRALYALGEMLAAVSQRFADPNQTVANGKRTDYTSSPGGIVLTNTKYGLLYCAPADTTCQGYYGYVSGSVQSLMAIAALYYFEQTGNGYYAVWARDTLNGIAGYMLTPAPADASRKAQWLVETELDLDPLAHSGSWGSKTSHTGGANPNYLKPVGQEFGKPVRGADSTYLGSSFSVAVLAARLYQTFGSEPDRTLAANLAAAIVHPQGYARTVGGQTLVCNCRDPFSDGIMAPAFARDVLTMQGVDPGGAVAAALVATARAIHASRTGSNLYTADWSGPETNPFTGRGSWQADWDADGASQAGSAQIMTNSQSASMAQAGWIVGRWSRRQ